MVCPSVLGCGLEAAGVALALGGEVCCWICYQTVPLLFGPALASPACVTRGFCVGFLVPPHTARRGFHLPGVLCCFGMPTVVIRGMEHFSHEERQRKMGLSSLEKRSLQGDLIVAF